MTDNITVAKIDLSVGMLASDEVYVGRRWTSRDRKRFLVGSILANPYRINRDDSNRREVIELYRKWLWVHICDGRAGNPNSVWQELLRLVKIYRESGSLYLSCWCSPKLCHGQVIKVALEWMIREDIV